MGELMNFTQRLRRNELLLGTMLTLPSPEVAEMIAACGYDWLFMDGEHGNLSRNLAWLVRLINRQSEVDQNSPAVIGD